MSRRKMDPLRVVSDEEQVALARLSRSQRAPAGQALRARALLAVAAGASYRQAAAHVGRHGNTVARWVTCFNRDGVAGLVPRHGGGPAVRYGAPEQQRILAEFARVPDRERDGTATWSLSTLKRALRAAEDGLPEVSTATIAQTLHAAGLSWQMSRSWCDTGVVVRKRKAGLVTVTDPDALGKKPDRAGLHCWARAGAVRLVRG